MDQTQSKKKPQVFLTDIQEIRRRAREHILSGAITPSYQGDPEASVKVLNEALATEIVCTLRYTNHYYMAEGIQAKAVADEFQEHANEEREHAEWLARRIRQLNGVPNFNPEGLLSRSHAEYHEGSTLVEMIQEDLIAERIAIESYGEMVTYFGDRDPVSRRLMEKILAKEEEHAEDLASLLSTLDPRKRPAQAA